MKNLWRSPLLRAVAVYGASGLAFAAANLILAGALPTVEYGLFTLVIALVNLGHALGTGGVDAVVVRRHLKAGPKLLQRSMLPGLIVGLALTIIAGLTFHLTIPMLLIVFVSTVAGGLMMVAGAKFQSDERFGISLALVQSPNLVLILAALAVVLSNGKAAWLPLLISALGFILAASAGWWLLISGQQVSPTREQRFPWADAFSYAGFNAAGLLLIQLDRLIIPKVLSVHDLATYGVLAAIVGSLFRVLSMSVGYTTVPRLRDAPGVLQRRALIVREAKLVGPIVAGGVAIIWLVTPLLEQWFLGDKYHLPGSLVLAALVTGVIRIANSFTRSVVSALATPAELSLVNLLGWGSIALAIPAAIVGARWGLAGVMYGVALGWLLRALAGFFVGRRHLKLPGPVPETARSQAAGSARSQTPL